MRLSEKLLIVSIRAPQIVRRRTYLHWSFFSPKMTEGYLPAFQFVYNISEFLWCQGLKINVLSAVNTAGATVVAIFVDRKFTATLQQVEEIPYLNSRNSQQHVCRASISAAPHTQNSCFAACGRVSAEIWRFWLDWIPPLWNQKVQYPSLQIIFWVIICTEQHVLMVTRFHFLIAREAHCCTLEVNTLCTMAINAASDFLHWQLKHFAVSYVCRIFLSHQNVFL